MRPLPPSRAIDFLVIGAQKAGTTTLFEHLRQHPETYLPPAKEVPYFGQEWPPGRYPGGWAQYLDETFAEAPPGVMWGTVTPQYMAGASPAPDGLGAGFESDQGRDESYIPGRIRADVPDARLIAILRDPAKRAYSQYRMEVLRGGEPRTFDEAIAQLLAPEELHSARRSPTPTNSYVVAGEYGRILTGYYETFPREQLLVVFTDELERTPGGTIRSILSHVGVDSDFVPSGLGERYRQGATRRRIVWLDLPRWQASIAANSALAGLWRRLSPPARLRLAQTYTRLEFRVELWNRIRAGDAHSALVSTDTRHALERHYVEDSKLLEQLIERRLPW